jgi:hypothetical protein
VAKTRRIDPHPASFRDPSGFLYHREDELLRQVNASFQANYDQLIQSGFYGVLSTEELLIPHQEVDLELAATEDAYKVLRPQKIPFISYPYEWCFSQLKDAALITLRIQRLAINEGMSLKDASAFNLQFLNGKPILIDSLSFESYAEGKPWIAYRQFCRHFLAPLALMALRDVRLSQLLRAHIDGLPLDLASSLLPRRSWLNLGLVVHLHLHAATIRRLAGMRVDLERRSRGMTRNAMLGLIDSLERLVKKLRWDPQGTQWADYEDMDHYPAEAKQRKEALVKEYLDIAEPKMVWDLGANVGRYSRVASSAGAYTVSIDSDSGAVEQNYLQMAAEGEKSLLPLLADLTNPSPSLGWHSSERDSLLARGPADAVLALALIHHLAISNNVPLDHLAEFFAQAGHWLVIEFVPKSDPQVRLLMAAREDIFTNYTQVGFEIAFEEFFHIHRAEDLPGTERRLYLMQAKA